MEIEIKLKEKEGVAVSPKMELSITLRDIKTAKQYQRAIEVLESLQNSSRELLEP